MSWLLMVADTLTSRRGILGEPGTDRLASPPIHSPLATSNPKVLTGWADHDPWRCEAVHGIWVALMSAGGWEGDCGRLWEKTLLRAGVWSPWSSLGL